MRLIFVLLLLVLIIVNASVGSAQRRDDIAKKREAEQLLNGKYTFEQLLQREPGAISNAKRVFALTTDTEIKQRLASVLLSLGEKDPVYFDYLKQEAEHALQNDMPWPTLYDEHGAKRSTTVNTLNPDFLKWCKEHHEDPASAFEAAYYEVPVPWYNLAAAGDQRSYSLLIQGLHSHNLMIQVWAAMGLAKLQDPGAIDPIIAAVRNAPAETHDAMAKVLLHFQDSKAQAAADELFAHKEYLEPLRQQIKQQGLKELFPY